MTTETTVALFNAFTPIILDALIVVIGIVVAAIGKQLYKIKASVANSEHASFLERVAEIAVQSAEQVYKAADGDAKKQHAINFAERYLEARGVKIDLDVLDDAIEAAVMREFNYPAAVEPAAPPTETTVTMAGGDRVDATFNNTGEDTD